MPQPTNKSNYGETDSPSKPNEMYPSIDAPSAPPEEPPSYPSPTSNLYPHLGKHNLKLNIFLLHDLRTLCFFISLLKFLCDKINTKI